eukprot:g7065.t1
MSLRTDNELDSAACSRVFADHGIKPEFTAAKSPASNAKIERFWGTIASMTTRMLADPELPHLYWDAAVTHAVRLHNALGRKGNNDNYRTPHQNAFGGRKANMTCAHVFGSLAAVHVPKLARDHKFSDRCTWGIWIGFAPNHSTKDGKPDPGRDYDPEHAYAPVAERATIKTQCAIAAAEGMLIGTLDIGQAYINAHNDRRHIFMRCPAGYGRLGNDGKPQMLHLLRSNYGMVQSGGNFYRHLRETLVKNCGFVVSKNDPCLLTYNRGTTRIILSLYVDDILYAVDSEQTRDRLVRTLQREYKGFGSTAGVKHTPCRPGQPATMLGIRVHDRRSDTGAREIFLEMSDVITELLNDYNLHNANDAKSPMSHDCMTDLGATGDHDRAPVAKHDVRGLLGRLLWISVCCRPDIAWAVNYCARYAHDPGKLTWTALSRIARYLKHTRGHGLRYRSGTSPHVNLEVHVDADHAECPTTRRSTPGAVYTVNGVAVYWRSRRQSKAVRSSTEAEMLAVAGVCTDIAYSRRILADMQQAPAGPTTVYCDNAGAARNTKYPTNRRTKHMNLHYAVARDHVTDGTTSFKDIDTADNPADQLTKPLGPTKAQQHRETIGVRAPRPDIPIIARIRTILRRLNSAPRSRHNEYSISANGAIPIDDSRPHADGSSSGSGPAFGTRDRCI